MIFRESININSEADYNKIAKSIDKQYLDEDFIDELRKIVGLQCKRVSVECPYYEPDYLSNYYIFYAKKLQKFPKECYRILFYKDRQEKHLIGYITLRPTYEGRRVGKIYFDPLYITKEKIRLIVGPCKCHIGGSESIIEIFPHMKQEGDVAVCAHVATWSVLRSFANRFHRYPELSLGKIVEMVSLQSERMIPTRGLTAFQISQIFLDAGFSPTVLSTNNSNPSLIKEAIVSYVESGIPMVAILSNRNHAIAVIGVGEYLPDSWEYDLETRIQENSPFESYSENGKEVTTNVVLSSRFYNSIVANDDNFFPYTVVRAWECSTPPECSAPYKISDIDRLIIPLHSRIQLAYEDVRTIFLRLMAANHGSFSSAVIGRIFLASANTYREYLNEECNALDFEIKQILISVEMPHFIWCAEVSSPSHYQNESPSVDGLVIFDSTSATVNPEPFVFLALPNGSVRFKDDSNIIDSGIPVKDGLSMPRFERNLKEVKPYV